ncbi:thioredoxin domain-containing protein 11 isoform X1 [Tympanuchus pallidicinctus]|uniref:thioredoxin domain-containing protein 11 isoform X1 n=3 Tax=Tympanuchus pallidicinctus TaxID=109042 RepID=UPI0022870D6F|nr:thioredoxin domain-containing protein 11 isoform X1 [Tympanuchus pallidicinctus]XP_052535425.1 thioredoxin domain-containing protein 11 isoform X1 [Tympanuchus pallidicinctus]
MSLSGGPGPGPADAPRLRPRAARMARRPELLCGAAIVLGCAFLVALKVTCSRAKDVTMPAKLPVNFFSTRSPVIDLFRGQLDYADHLRQDSEVALYFFYAPWCGQSVAVREEIEHVASRLSDQVLFVAINCWWNQGKCRKQKHFFYFPVIHLYHRSFGPIEYKGPMSAVYIEKFVRRVMTPLLYISSRSKLLDFLSNYEPGVVGYFEFNASPQPPGYLTFFTSALHSLKKDYLGTVRFGVVTDKLVAEEISLVHSGSVYLHRHINTSLIYPNDTMNYTAENVCKWALENRELLIRWLRPHGGKSLLLNNELKKGPALLVFVPYDPLAEIQPLLDEITKVALEYHSCNKSQGAEPELQHLGSSDSPASDSSDPDAHMKLADTFLITKYPCCNTVVLPQWHSISRTHNVCELCINQTLGVKPDKVSVPRCNFFEIETALDSFYLQEHTFFQVVSSSIECSNFLSFYSPFSYYTACCRTVDRHFLSFISSEKTIFQTPKVAFSSHGKKDNADIQNSIPHIEDRNCFIPDLHIAGTNITGLSCRTNKTLNLYLLDSNLFWIYAERLGASRSTHRKEFAAIVDLKEELHYVLDQNQSLTGSTLENFIKNFSILYSPLKRHLVDGTSVRVPAERVVAEVTTSTFHHIVFSSEKNVLLLYYAQWCGFCASLNHIFIQLARLLPPDHFTVARIDTTQNDLPWEFMTDRLPTILFFPQQRKDQSVKFPEDFPVSLPHLLKFILHHSSLSSSEPCTKECLHKETVLQQGHISHLEQEIQKLRSEIRALHQAHESLEAQLSEARREEHRLQQQKHTLEKQHKTLQLHSQQLQATYDQKNRELLEMAEKLQELADASENLLKENTLLRILVASREGKLQSKDEPKEALQSEQTVADDSSVLVSAALSTEEKRIDRVDAVATEHSSENRTE